MNSLKPLDDTVFKLEDKGEKGGIYNLTFKVLVHESMLDGPKSQALENNINHAVSN